MTVSVYDPEFSHLLQAEKRRLRETGRETYIAEAFQRMRAMAAKQDARNAKLKGQDTC